MSIYWCSLYAAVRSRGILSRVRRMLLTTVLNTTSKTFFWFSSSQKKTCRRLRQVFERSWQEAQVFSRLGWVICQVFSRSGWGLFIHSQPSTIRDDLKLILRNDTEMIECMCVCVCVCVCVFVCQDVSRDRTGTARVVVRSTHHTYRTCGEKNWKEKFCPFSSLFPPLSTAEVPPVRT